jgi:hypothetical protein
VRLCRDATLPPDRFLTNGHLRQLGKGKHPFPDLLDTFRGFERGCKKSKDLKIRLSAIKKTPLCLGGTKGVLKKHNDGKTIKEYKNSKRYIQGKAPP